MKTKKYVEYMVEETKKILAIDSPSGYTADVADYVMKAYHKGRRAGSAWRQGQKECRDARGTH